MNNENEEEKVKRPFIENLFVSIPLILIFVGGALGGAAAGAAITINLKIIKSDFPAFKRYALYLATFIASILFYIMIVTVLYILFPNLFNQA